MSKHRSLSNALLTPEKLAFIKGNNATESETSRSVPLVTEPTSVRPESDIAADKESKPKSDVLDNSNGPHTSIDSKAVSQRTLSTAANEDYLVAITTRLQARTAEALRRAYLEQKLNRREPATQQEIIEAALQTWLRKHAFLE